MNLYVVTASIDGASTPVEWWAVSAAEAFDQHYDFYRADIKDGTHIIKTIFEKEKELEAVA